jgi:MoxR-like ATPase
MAHLRILTGPPGERIIPLRGAAGITIGRDPGCTVVLETDSPASRRHASVYAAADGWHLRDLGSSNGTMLNGGWVTDHVLAAGDQFQIADSKFVYEDQPSGQGVAAPALSARDQETDVDVEAVVRSMSEKTKLITQEIGKAIIGQTAIIGQLLTAIISNGHVLMIGMPGLAKTLLVRTVSEVLDLEFRRIQFTPDLMPSDITGTDILEVDEATGKKEYRFIRGPIFTNILLADEINRTPPKTQAALLEAMQEHCVTAAGQTLKLAPPFFVLATQNPLEQEGTYPLPEAQLDRFMFSIYVDYPPEEDEATIAKVTTRQEKIELRKVLDGPEILALQHVVRTLPISDHVVLFATRLVRATRPGDPRSPDFIKKWIHAGAGVRASQYLVVAAKARAVTAGRLVVTCDDVRAAARPILRHRMFTNFTADSEGMDTDKIVQKLLETIEEPGEKDYAGSPAALKARSQ